VTVYPYSSTHRLLELGDDRLLKELAPQANRQRPSGRLAAVEDPAREPAAYRCVLGPLDIGPRCFDTGADWVLLEWVRAKELWQIGELPVWSAVAGWLARLHGRLAGAVVDRVPLVVHDEPYFRAFRERAASSGVPAIVLEAHERATARLLALPGTVVHGDLYPSNVLVDAGPPLRVWPVDWELIGWGPAVLDLAALTSGAWSPAQREAMVSAYTSSTGRAAASRCGMSLDAARLHLCVQWLGTSPEWTPPPDHAHDWLDEALELAVAL
jgi:Phosphotransferase enzyme family